MPKTEFATWLRSQLTAKRLGVWTLAKRIDPQRPDIARRSLYRYLTGTWPREKARAAIAAALNVADEEMPRPEKSAPFRRRAVGGGADRGAPRDARTGGRGSCAEGPRLAREAA